MNQFKVFYTTSIYTIFLIYRYSTALTSIHDKHEQDFVTALTSGITNADFYIGLIRRDTGKLITY